jgi:HK97 family phage portal protein
VGKSLRLPAPFRFYSEKGAQNVNIFQRIFGGRPQTPPPSMERAEVLSGNTTVFTPWSGDAYGSDIYRGAVDAIARNAAKLKGVHVVRQQGRATPQQGGKLNRILQTEPNPYMNTFDFLYRMITHYYLFNNAFAFLQKDDYGEVLGVFPIGAAGADFMADPTGRLFVNFRFNGGKEVILPYSDVVHLRRHYNGNDLLGDPNTAIIPALELAHTQSEGIINAIKSGATIRGVLSFTQILAPEKLKAEKDAFMADYLSMSNNGGIIALDQKMSYEPITTTPVTINKQQTDAAKAKIYDYLGVSEKIVNSSYTEDEWAAFYESTIEPIAVQLSLEFTRKIFSDREQGFGNSILFESGRLQFASNATKVTLIRELVPLGLLTVNQALEILNLPSVEDGDRRVQTLNVVAADKADQYQLGGKADERNQNSGN